MSDIPAGKPAKPAKPMKPVKPHGGSIARLLRLVNEPELVKGVWAMTNSRVEELRKTKPDTPKFPERACGATLSTFLEQAGFPQSFGTWAQSEINEALTEGWTRTPSTPNPQPGDIFVCVDANGNGATDHVGIVARPSSMEGWMWAVDNRTDQCKNGQPYLRNIASGRFTPVAYFIRYQPAQECATLVSRKD